VADVKWIKLSTSMFEDEKIRLIESLPEADTILIIWIKLLAQAGKTNASGYIYLNEHIPYTDEMLATIFNRPIGTVRLAINTFQQFGMIEITDDHFISVTNWAKHQSLTGLDKIREDTKKRVAEHRERKKQQKLINGLGNVTGNKNVTDIEEEKEEEIEKEKNNIPFSEIVTYLNEKTSSSYRTTSKKTQQLIKARWNEGFTLDDFKTVIDKKSSEWFNNKEMCIYLRPETLFGTKFEAYLNQKGGVTSAETNNSSEIAKEYDFGF
jgi:predicted phage replisome organizer/uncharacterized phage protein (TIGR02220 family)